MSNDVGQEVSHPASALLAVKRYQNDTKFNPLVKIYNDDYTKI